MSIREAVVLAGGKGVRLQSVVKDRPKPMAMVFDRPFLEWIILDLKRKGIQKIILATGFRGDQIESYFGNGKQWGVDIVYSQEDVPLGTGGGLRKALPLLSSNEFLVLNGDSYCIFDLHALSEFHQHRKAFVTLWLTRVEHSQRFGSVVIDADGYVTRFCEKESDGSSGVINAGVYLFCRDVVQRISIDTVLSLENELFPALVGKGLCGVVGATHSFIDIGTPESYQMAGGFFLQEGIMS